MTVTVSGPMFNGQAARAVRDFCDDWEEEYAEDTESAVHARLKSVLRHPTGNYQSHIAIRSEDGGRVIHDSGIIYGPWLEGTGSRNAPKTRFKGYSTFRKVAQAQQRKAEPNARRLFRSRYLGRMT